MTTAEIQFDILSYWHAGSGSGQGADLDAVVVKSAAGLPYLPGKTVKGLCREAVTILVELGKIEIALCEKWFGGTTKEASDRNKNELGKSRIFLDRYITDPGKLWFANATLADDMEAWAREQKDQEVIRALYAQLSSTKIEENGLAADKSLRKIEVAIPLTLTARIEADGDDKGWIEVLRQAAPLMRSLGSHRRRGMGRVQVSVREVSS